VCGLSYISFKKPFVVFLFSFVGFFALLCYCHRCLRLFFFSFVVVLGASLLSFKSCHTLVVLFSFLPLPLSSLSCLLFTFITYL